MCIRDSDERMVHFLEEQKTLSEAPALLRADEEKKILIFRRKNAIFALNFNPTQSYENYGFETEDGEYELSFNTDEGAYDGFDRLRNGELHVTTDHTLRLYLPSRCGLVLVKR